MGRTVLPYSQVWEAERQRWQKFRRALRREDQVHLDRLFELARLHLQAGVYASNPWPLESLFLSMLLEHQKVLSALEERLRQLEAPEKTLRGRARERGSLPSPNTPPNPLKGDIAAGADGSWLLYSCPNCKGLGRGFGGRERAPALCPSPKYLPTNPMKTTGWLFDLYPLDDRMVLWFITETGQRLRLEDDFPYCLYLGGPQARLQSLARALGQKGWLRRAYPHRGRDLWTGREIPVVALEVKAYGLLPRVRQWLGTLPG